jgi:hypothetical protein
VKILGGACVVAAVAAALSACGSSHRASTAVTGAPVSARTVSTSRLILGGRVRCTATATTPVEAGHEIAVTFSLRNLSGSTARAPLDEASTRLVLRAGDGTRYDTAAALRAEGSLGGPYRLPLAIHPGETETLGSQSVFVRWKGPLHIIPGCDEKPLPPLHVQVSSPGPPPDDRSAVADVVAATGHLLDRCRPQQPGVAVDGEIKPPTGSGPAMEARCSVSLHSEGGFLVAQVLVLIPPNLRGVHVVQPYDTLSFRKHRRPYESIAWQLVVTRDGAVTVAGFTHDATRAGKRMAPEWSWSGTSWGRPGSARCGYEGFAGGPTLDLISVCPS